jgi:hypothetical protein
VDRRQAIESVAVAGAVFVLFWAINRAGGRDPYTSAWAVPLALPAVVLTRPWELLPRWVLGFAVAVPAGAFAICLVDPLGFAHAQDLGVWPYGAELFLLTAGFARTAERRRFVAASVCLLGVYEFAKAMVPYASWHNTHPLVGTFYGDNQFGAFAAAIAVFGGALALSKDRLLRPLGAAAAFTGGLACALSLSLASTVLLVAAAGALVAAVVVADGRRLARAAGLGAIAAMVVVCTRGLQALVGPPPAGAKATWLPNYGVARLSLDKWDDVRARLHYWNVAWHDFLASPWTGRGHGWFGLHFGQTMHPGEYFSHWTHNGVMQALADGGLLFGLPVAVAAAALLVSATRRMARARRLVDADPIVLGAALAVTVLALHAQFDFDWNYPILAGVLGLVGGLVAAPTREPVTEPVESG